MRQRLVDRLVGVVHVHVLADDADRDLAVGVAQRLDHLVPAGELGAPAAQMVSHLLTDATTALPMVLVMFGFAVASTAAFVGLVARR